MKVGVWFYGVGTLLTGSLDIIWGDFDISHQPILPLGISAPAQHILAYVTGFALVLTGLAIIWKRSAKMGAVASAVAYAIFSALWMAGYYARLRGTSSRVNVVLGVSFGLAQQVMLIAPAVIVYICTVSLSSSSQKKAVVGARWMLGLPAVLFGIFHLLGLRVFASIVPHWMSFGYFWAALTGVAFILAGCAICSGKVDILALKLLALMLLLFEFLVEIPPIVARLHNEATWGAAVYNVTAIGACLIFAEFFASRANRTQVA